MLVELSLLSVSVITERRCQSGAGLLALPGKLPFSECFFGDAINRVW